MGLSKEVRDYFITRINKFLDQKIKDLQDSIDEEKFSTECVRRLVEKTMGHHDGFQLLDSLNKNEAELKRVLEEREKLSYQVLKIMRVRNPRYVVYHNLTYSDLESEAKECFGYEVKSEWYPSIKEDIDKLQKTKDTAEATIMMATTQTKMINSLNSVLKSYGGDINDMIVVLPKEK